MNSGILSDSSIIWATAAVVNLKKNHPECRYFVIPSRILCDTFSLQHFQVDDLNEPWDHNVMAAQDVTYYHFPTAGIAAVRKKYDELRIKKRFDSVTPEEQDWMDWAERYLDQKEAY